MRFTAKSVCGSVGGGEPLCEWNGAPWEHFIEKQSGGRRGTDRRPNLVRREGQPQRKRLIFWLACNWPYDGE